jgi:hypothetical protein
MNVNNNYNPTPYYKPEEPKEPKQRMHTTHIPGSKGTPGYTRTRPEEWDDVSQDPMQCAECPDWCTIL